MAAATAASDIIMEGFVRGLHVGTEESMIYCVSITSLRAGVPENLRS